MNIKLLFIAIIFGLAVTADYESDEGVAVLTDDNFDGVLASVDHVLVMFYAPWCGHCKSLKPEYALAAQQLASDGSSVVLGKVDATVQTALAGRFEVKGYPTLKFFVGGSPMDYSGPREKAGIVTWVNKKTQPATSVVGSTADLETLKAHNNVLVVFVGSEASDEFVLFSKLAQSDDELVFRHVTDAAVGSELGVEGTGLVLFKNFDEGRNDYEGEWDLVAVQAWLKMNSVATVFHFDQKAAQSIFGGGNQCLFLFVESENDPTLAVLEEASVSLKGKVLMSWATTTEGLDQRLAEYIGVTSADVPCARLVDTNGGDVKKYVFDGDMDAAHLVQFWEDFSAGKVHQHLKSEPVPTSQEDNVVVLVGLNHEEVVMDSTKDVLVEYYAPWCGHCKALAPLYEAFATTIRDVENFVVAKMDSTANEVSGLNIQGFPTLKFYPANNKSPVDYEGGRDEEGLMAFARSKSSGVVDWTVLDGGSDDVVEEVEVESTKTDL